MIKRGAATRALVRETRLGGGQLQQRDLAGAERERRHRRQLRLDAEALRVIDRRADTDLLEQLRGGAVARDLQGGAQRVLRLLVAAAGKPRSP